MSDELNKKWEKLGYVQTYYSHPVVHYEKVKQKAFFDKNDTFETIAISGTLFRKYSNDTYYATFIGSEELKLINKTIKELSK